MSTPTVGRRRPSRLVQVVVWLLFGAALVTGFSLSSYKDAGTPAGPAATATAAGSDTSVLAEGPTARGSNVELIVDTYAEDSDELLPAYRWRSSLDLPNDYSTADRLAPGGDDVQSMFAKLLFSIAAWTWWLLLQLVKFAVGMDLVSSAAIHIDAAFASAAEGLGASGLPILAVVIAVGLAAMRILKGRGSQAVSLIVGAVLVVGGLQFLTASAQGSGGTKEFQAGGTTIHAASKGSPAYLAQRGNAFVNDLANTVTTGFGTTNALTDQVSEGKFASAGDTDGATCSFYVQQLYATYSKYTDAATEPGEKITHNALSLVSFMWQRGLYDNWTMAAFGSLDDGSRISCHMLEKSRGTQPMEQFALVGGEGQNGKATEGPYAGMRLGPFVPDATSGGEGDQRAARLAWAACGGSNGQKARPGWEQAGRVTDEACSDWWNWVPGDKSIGDKIWDAVPGTGSDEVGINSGDAENVLFWDGMDEVYNSTTWNGEGGPENGEALNEVRTVVSAYYGHNGGQRMFAGLMSVISAFLYAWAFGASAIGTIITQVGLLFLLTMLPYTLLMLALPSKDGSRNKGGVRMMKMTGAFFAGKLVFIALLGVTVQLMSTLFVVAGSFTGSSSSGAAGDGSLVMAAGGTGSGMYMIWSLIIPAATIFILRAACKGLGLGDLMSLSGAAGFATSAVLSGKDGKRARRGFQDGLKGSFVGRALDRADNGVKKGLKAPGTAARKQLAKEVGGGKLSKALRDGAISEAQFSKVASGKMSLAEAKAEAKAEQSGLRPALQRAVARGQMTMGQARNLETQLRKQEADKAADKADTPADPIGGYEGAEKRLALLGADGEEYAGPVFKSTLDAAADDEALRALQTERRSILEIKNKDVDEEGWEANALESSLDARAALRAGAQGLEVGVSLNAAQIQGEKDRLSELTGIPSSMIILGDSGAPPLIAPVPRDPVTGNFMWPEGLSDEARLRMAMNPMNYLDISKAPDETLDEFHLRAAMTLDAAGAMDVVGNFADLVKGEGVDIGTVAGRAEVLLAMAGDSKELRLEDLKLTVPDAELRVIETVVRDHYPTPQHTEVAAKEQQVADVAALSSQAAAQAQAVRVEIEQTVNHAIANPSSSLFTEDMDRALRMIEERIPSVLEDLGAVTVEARASDEWLKGAVSDQSELMAQFRSMAQAGEESIDELRRELTSQVAQIKLANDPSVQAAQLKALMSSVEDLMDDVSSEMARDVEKMLGRSAEAARTRDEQLASQLRAPVRASDFSGGANDLTS